jgi:O-antigen/teichoic acid export membrane protein
VSGLKKLASQTAVYGLSSIFARAINFLLVPFYTRLMEPDDFGILSEYMVYIAFLIVFVTFGMETTYFRYSQEKETEEKTFSNLFTFVFGLSLLVCGTVILCSPFLKDVLRSSGNILYINLLSGMLFLDAVSSLSFARLRNQGKSMNFALFKISSIFLNVLLNLLFIMILPKYFGLNKIAFIDLNDQVGAILWANLLANSLFLLFFVKDFKLLFKNWDLSFVKKAFPYAYPIMILGLAGMVNEMIDRLMLKELLPKGFYNTIGIDNLGAIGVYSANYKFAIFITLAIQAYRYAAEPFFFKTGQEKNSKQTFSKLMTIFTAILLITTVLISLFRQEIAALILGKPEYITGLSVVPILLLANVCVGVYYNLSAWYKLTDKTIYGTIIGIGGAIVTVVANWILIPKMGYMGCAWATLICYATMMLSSYVLGQKYYPVPYQIARIFVMFLVSVSLILFSVFILESMNYGFIFRLILALFSIAGFLFLVKGEYSRRVG